MKVSSQTSAASSHAAESQHGNGAAPGSNTGYTKYYGTGEKSEVFTPADGHGKPGTRQYFDRDGRLNESDTVAPTGRTVTQRVFNKDGSEVDTLNNPDGTKLQVTRDAHGFTRRSTIDANGNETQTPQPLPPSVIR